MFIRLFVDFCMSDSNGRVTSIKHRTHIKSLFVSMLHQIWNPRYSRHIRIIICVGLEPFFLAINLNVLSSFNVFSSLISMFIYKIITIMNQ